MSLVKVAQRNKEGEKHPTRYYSKKQESAVAESLKGKKTKNSGATMFGGKADVLTNDFAIECKTKTTDSESISIKKSWIEKLKRESLFDGKSHYALAINFGSDSPNYYIIDEFSFQEYISSLEKNK